ncbi:hypothetical protein COO60DRAFT_188956 [Scenedesmus sp. NREL 46B-D3]|nr:hypothetical protein COO60DRAFT_188956 [Scenedesmus sp. NREL 46B-D3]
MAASMMKISSPAVAARTATAPCAYAAAAPKPARKPVVCRSYELLAAVGDVDAPIAVPLVAAVVVTAAVTFLVPAYLQRGQAAADTIFDKDAAKRGAKATSGKKATTSGKKTTRR